MASKQCIKRLVSATLLAGAAYAQSPGPAENVGASTKPMGNIDLATDLGPGAELAGRQLRARLVTIAPGGHTAAHEHVGRPTLEYVLAGEVVEVRNGVETPHAAGDLVVGSGGVRHWWENRGKVPVMLLPVDVFKP